MLDEGPFPAYDLLLVVFVEIGLVVQDRQSIYRKAGGDHQRPHDGHVFTLVGATVTGDTDNPVGSLEVIILEEASGKSQRLANSGYTPLHVSRGTLDLFCKRSSVFLVAGMCPGQHLNLHAFARPLHKRDRYAVWHRGGYGLNDFR